MSHAACVFCGATGATAKISKEHTFSDWINRVLPQSVVGPDLTYERRAGRAPGAGTANIWPVSQVASHKVRAVCQRCNAGWMSDLEVQTRPLIEPMILGQNTSLTQHEQITVATWASLKAAVFEYTWDAEPIMAQVDRAILMAEKRPPAKVQVRLAAIESRGYPLTARALGYERRGMSDMAFCLTLSMGCLVIQVFGGPGADHHNFRIPGGSGPTWIGVYPPALRTVQWPPETVLDDVTLRGFADVNPFGSARVREVRSGSKE